MQVPYTKPKTYSWTSFALVLLAALVIGSIGLAASYVIPLASFVGFNDVLALGAGYYLLRRWKVSRALKIMIPASLLIFLLHRGLFALEWSIASDTMSGPYELTETIYNVIFMVIPVLSYALAYLLIMRGSSRRASVTFAIVVALCVLGAAVSEPIVDGAISILKNRHVVQTAERLGAPIYIPTWLVPGFRLGTAGSIAETPTVQVARFRLQYLDTSKDPLHPHEYEINEWKMNQIKYDPPADCGSDAGSMAQDAVPCHVIGTLSDSSPVYLANVGMGYIVAHVRIGSTKISLETKASDGPTEAQIMSIFKSLEPKSPDQLLKFQQSVADQSHP